MKNRPSLEEITAIAEEAYIFAFPLLENYRTMNRLTGSHLPDSQRRSFNTLRHAAGLLGPEFKNIVAPNNDTMYSSSWLDLENDPLVLSIPDIPDRRYHVFQMVNMYNHNFGYVGSRTTGHEAGDYMIVNHDWEGILPDGINRVFKSETRFVFLLGRTLVEGTEDVANVKTIQQGYRLRSLDNFSNGKNSYQPPLPELVPYDAEKGRSVEFITYLNLILGNAAIHPDEAAMIKGFGSIGVEPGKTFCRDSLSAEEIGAIEKGITQALEKIDHQCKNLSKTVNGWNSLVDSHGPREVMGGRYLVNAAGAKMGLYGNDKEEAANFFAYSDEEGFSLDGKRSYVLHFTAEQFPPVNAFWSITMYRMPEILLVANPIDRYSIGDRTRNLRYEQDGSLQIYISHSSPGPEKESNWLPAPEGPFILALRCYLPDQIRFRGYHPPAVKVN